VSLRTTPFHARTGPLSEGQAWRRWAGYVVASSYELSHEREYHAIRNAAALFDVSPLYKYLVTGRDAARLLDHVVTRNVGKAKVGQVLYTPWCDAEGKQIDDGTISVLEEDRFRMTAADPTLRWLHLNSSGLDVALEDVSERTAALSLQGPNSRAILQVAAQRDLSTMKYFRLTSAQIRGIPVTISRTGYTGDLGYEIWVDSAQAVPLWDALIETGAPYGVTPAGMLALDVARVEAGLLLIDVDFNSSKKALADEQRYTPFEMGLARLVNLDKNRFVGQAALIEEQKRGPAREIVGLEIDWPQVESIYETVGLPPAVSPIASRVAVPVFKEGMQVGKATTTTWSPTLKRMIALATVRREYTRPGTRLQFEITVEAVRHHVRATVVKTPFFNPKRKTATPIT